MSGLAHMESQIETCARLPDTEGGGVVERSAAYLNVRLLRGHDHSYGTHDNVWMHLLDRLYKRNLRGWREKGMVSCYRAGPCCQFRTRGRRLMTDDGVSK